MEARYQLTHFTINTLIGEYIHLSYDSTVPLEHLEHHLSCLILSAIGMDPSVMAVVWFNENGDIYAIPKENETLSVIIRPPLRMILRVVDQYKKSRHQDLFTITLFSSISSSNVHEIMDIFHALCERLDQGYRQTFAHDLNEWTYDLIGWFEESIHRSLRINKGHVGIAPGLRYHVREIPDVLAFICKQMDFSLQLVVHDTDLCHDIMYTRQWLSPDQPFYRPWTPVSDKTREHAILLEASTLEQVLQKMEWISVSSVSTPGQKRGQGPSYLESSLLSVTTHS